MVRGTYCKVQTEKRGAKRRCAAANLLGFTQYLRSLRLFPMLRRSTVYQQSPKFLATQLLAARYAVRIADTISVDRRGSAPVEPSPHVQCHVEFQLKPIITRILEDISWPLEIPSLDSIEINGGKYQLKPMYSLCMYEKTFYVAG